MSVEYDIMVILILAFIFLTPQHLFRDQPRPFPAHPAALTLVTEAHGHVYEVLGASPNASRADLQNIVSKYAGHSVTVQKVRTIRGDQPSSVIYNVWTD